MLHISKILTGLVLLIHVYIVLLETVTVQMRILYVQTVPAVLALAAFYLSS